jgi:predicted nucleotidyltransferase
MSKQTAASKTTGKSARATAANGRRQARAAKAAEAERLDSEKFWAAYREWHQVADSTAKRRAYIRKMCRRIAEEFKPEKIILFGSYAYGKPSKESDVDLLVVMPCEGGYFQQVRTIRRRLNLALPLDLLIYTPAEMQSRLETGDCFVREIVERGRVMYEAQHA